MKWLEISLTLRDELVEPVAELLGRYSDGGVAIESQSLNDPPNPAGSLLGLVVRAYLPSDGSLEQRRRSIEEGLWHLGQIQAIPTPTYRWAEEEDWAEAWKKHFQALPVGRRLLVLPAWSEPDPSPRVAIRINPGMAFGTGSHPSTQLCLEAMEERVRAGDLVVDLGCGSGILAIAAALFGASRILAFDVDPAAVRAAQENAERNGLSGQIEVHQGGLEALLARLVSSTRLPDLLAANIHASILGSMLRSGMAGAVRPGGRLILSGLLDEQAPAVQEEAEQQGLLLEELRSRDDWRALVLKRLQPP